MALTWTEHVDANEKAFFICRRGGTIVTGMNEGERARESRDGKARGRLFAPGSPS
jgi:hypothetical protein